MVLGEWRGVMMKGEKRERDEKKKGRRRQGMRGGGRRYE